MQLDSPQEHEGSQQEEEEEARQPWELTRARKRIAELKEIEDNIAVLLHFAGCALASLHPDPLSSFTSREIETGGDEDEEGNAKPALPEGEDKAADFGKYAEAYYTTLNDVQVGLRTSIRHLRVTRTSPAPLLDPSFGSLGGSTGPQPSQVGVGGLALADLLAPLESTSSQWNGRNARSSTTNDRGKGEETNKLSIAARELEREAWKDLADALEGNTTSL